MSARGRMTHRARLERDTAASTGAWGQPAAPDWNFREELPCYGWSRSRQVVADGEKVVTVQEMRAIFPTDADIVEGDRLQEITDRRGTVVFPGPLMVRTAQAKPGHVEFMLERV